MVAHLGTPGTLSNRGNVTGGTQDNGADRGNYDYSVQGQYPSGPLGMRYDSLNKTLSAVAGNTIPAATYNLRYTVIDLDYQYVGFAKTVDFTVTIQ